MIDIDKVTDLWESSTVRLTISWPLRVLDVSECNKIGELGEKGLRVGCRRGYLLISEVHQYFPSNGSPIIYFLNECGITVFVDTPQTLEVVRQCPVCELVKPLSEFDTYLAYKCKWANCCSTCVVRHENREVTLQKYGINWQDYMDFLVQQGGRCAICSKPEPPPPEVLVVDHCHDVPTRRGKAQYKSVRGLLCRECNMGIGKLQHNSDYLRKAAAYIEDFLSKEN